MTERDPNKHARKPAFDNERGYSGQDYDLAEERRLAAQLPAGSVASAPSRVGGDPRAAGRRASFDPVTGEVRGSGASAGGGSPGEDMNQGPGGGDRTGAFAHKPSQ